MFELEWAEWMMFRTMYQYTYKEHLRYGQAFYNHFQLHKMNKSLELALALDQIYEEADENRANAMILELFEIK